MSEEAEVIGDVPAEETPGVEEAVVESEPEAVAEELSTSDAIDNSIEQQEVETSMEEEPCPATSEEQVEQVEDTPVEEGDESEVREVANEETGEVSEVVESSAVVVDESCEPIENTTDELKTEQSVEIETETIETEADSCNQKDESPSDDLAETVVEEQVQFQEVAEENCDGNIEKEEQVVEEVVAKEVPAPETNETENCEAEPCERTCDGNEAANESEQVANKNEENCNPSEEAGISEPVPEAICEADIQTQNEPETVEISGAPVQNEETEPKESECFQEESCISTEEVSVEPNREEVATEPCCNGYEEEEVYEEEEEEEEEDPFEKKALSYSANTSAKVNDLKDSGSETFKPITAQPIQMQDEQMRNAIENCVLQGIAVPSTYAWRNRGDLKELYQALGKPKDAKRDVRPFKKQFYQKSLLLHHYLYFDPVNREYGIRTPDFYESYYENLLS